MNTPILIEDSATEAVKEYISYILNGRVLPRLDGLKPVQRRILWSMILMGCRTKFRKSAIIIGEAMKYHPHGSCLDGDTIVYSDKKEYIKPIREIYESGVSSIPVLSITPEGEIIHTTAHSFRIGTYTTEKYHIDFSNGGYIECTANHPLLVNWKEWKRADEIKKGDTITNVEIFCSYPNPTLPIIPDSLSKTPSIFYLFEEYTRKYNGISSITYEKYLTERNSFRFCPFISQDRFNEVFKEYYDHSAIVTNISVKQVESTPMYDFTVDKYENMFVYSKRNKDDSGNLITVHNSSIYTALINLVSSPNNLVEGQGNWGSEEDSQAAAERYTEAKTSDIFESLFDESCTNKDLGEFVPNFSEDEMEPYTLQFKLPLARLIGVSGIGMGFNTSTPSFSFSYVRDQILSILHNSTLPSPEYAYGGSQFGNYIYPTAEIVTRNKKKYLHVTDIPIGATKMEMNHSSYLRELLFSEQMEIIDESDVTAKNPISIFISGPQSALKFILESMRIKLFDKLSYYNERVRKSSYEESWIRFRKKYIAKREYYNRERQIFSSLQKKSLSEISSVIKNSSHAVFQELVNRIGKDIYREYVNLIQSETAKQFMKTEKVFLSTLLGKPVSSVREYPETKVGPITDYTEESLSSLLEEEINSLNEGLFHKPTEKYISLPSLSSFSDSVRRYVGTKNGFPCVSFKPFTRVFYYETEGDISVIFEDGSTEVLSDTFFGEVKASELETKDKSIVGFSISELPTVFVTHSNKILCYRRASSVGEMIKTAFPACVISIDKKKRKMRAGLVFENVKEYKIVSHIKK